MAKRKRTFGQVVRGKKKKVNRSLFAGFRRGPTNPVKVRMGMGFPSRVTMTHKYRETVTLASTAGVMATYAFNANGMYDPNQSGTGTQPMYFDQMTALYDHYVVNSSTIKVTFVPAAVHANPGQIALYQNDDVSTAPTSIARIGEQTTGVAKIFGPEANYTLSLKNKYSCPKIWGANPLALSTQQGSGTANPTEGTIWTLAYEAGNGSNQSVLATVEITYNATWTEVKDQAGS